MFSFGLWVDMLAKAVGHKYIKRIPYQHKGKQRYRYIYKVTHSHQGRHAFDEAHLQIGTAFSLSTKAGSEYHGHVTKIEGDQVSYRIDDGPEKGTVKTTSKQKLLAKLNDVHDIESRLSSERDKLRNQIKEARENKASKKQIARLESRLSRLGGKQGSEKQEPEVIRGKITPEDLRQYKKIDTEGAGAFEKMSTVELERLEERLEDVRDTFSRRISSKVREFDRESGLDEATERLKEAEFDWEHEQRVHGSDEEPRLGATYAQRKQFREARDAYERAEREHDALFSKIESERDKIISNEDKKLALLDPVLQKRGLNDMADLIADELAERRVKEETKRTREEATRRQEAQRRKEAEEAEKKGRAVREMVTEAREIDRIVQEGGTGEEYEKKSATRGDYEAETPEERYKNARDNMSNVSDADDYKHAITQIKNLVDRGKVTIEQGYLLRRMLRGLNPLDKTPEELNTEEAEDYEVLSDASDVFNSFIDIYEEE